MIEIIKLKTEINRNLEGKNSGKIITIVVDEEIKDKIEELQFSNEILKIKFFGE